MITNENKICQSCGIELTEEILGTNIDGSPSPYYCGYCYVDGSFTEELTLEQAIQAIVSGAVENGINEEDALRFANKNLPLLKRWKQ